jgi:hypothetical protein
VTDGGKPSCNFRPGDTFADFLAAGRSDCVYDFGDAGSVTFSLSTEEGDSPMKKHKQVETPAQNEPEPLPAQPAVPTVTMPPIVGVTTATVGVPENAIAEVKSLIPAGGDANMVTVALAVVGVAGGGAAWKFYQSHSKNKHEEAMKKLEIEQQRSEKQDDQHQACNASRMALEAKVAALSAQVEKMTSTGSSFDLGDFDPSEIEHRLKKIEAALKPAPKGKKK